MLEGFKNLLEVITGHEFTYEIQKVHNYKLMINPKIKRKVAKGFSKRN